MLAFTLSAFAEPELLGEELLDFYITVFDASVICGNYWLSCEDCLVIWIMLPLFVLLICDLFDDRFGKC